MNTAVLGASHKSQRYSYQAVMLLQEKGHCPFPVHPTLKEIEGIPVFPHLADIPVPVEILTIYMNAQRTDAIANEILACPAAQVIFNPGAENPPLAEKLRAKGVTVLEACTLVLLRTGQFARQT